MVEAGVEEDKGVEDKEGWSLLGMKHQLKIILEMRPLPRIMNMYSRIQRLKMRSVGQKEEVHAETTCIPPLNPVLDKEIIVPKVGGTVGNHPFFHPFLGPIITGNEHEILTKFMKWKPPVFHGFDTEDA